jgi:pimeloyl-ACP methyl ester carboxylesterase
MPRIGTIVLTSALLSAVAASPAAGGAAPDRGAGSPKRVLEPCALEGVMPPAECGTIQVAEDRRGSGERRIELRIVRLGATGAETATDPLFILLGGPGSAAAGAAAGIAWQFAAARVERPLVLVDQRGTGGSHPLECDLYPGDGVARFAGDLFAADVVGGCRDALQEQADLTKYTTIQAVEDLDEVRRALGYEQINLYGVSYGTRVALEFMRRHPEAVRSAVLHGVSAPWQLGRYARAPNAQRALEGILEECRASETCRDAFPEVHEQVHLLFERLRDEPAEVEVLDPATGTMSPIRLSADLAAEAVRYMLYSPRTAGFVPLILRDAARGELQALAEFAVAGRQHIVNSGGNGMYLSITCAEDLGVGDRALASTNARGTFWSDYTDRQLHAVCDRWPLAAMPDEFREPVSFQGPVLVLSGEWDPATPASQGAEAAARLPNSRHLVVPHGGHDFEGLRSSACVRDLIASFFRHPLPGEVDTACLATIERPPFHTQPLPMKPIRVDPAQLASLRGRYASQELGFSVAVQATDDRLRLLLPDGLVIPLVAVAPTRFRPAGQLGTYFDFEVGATGVRVLRIEQVGAESLQLEWVGLESGEG